MTDSFTIHLAPGQALTVAAAPMARRLVVTRGRAWLTVSSDAQDHWLLAGEGLTVAPGQAVVAEGWPQASFQLLQPLPRRRTQAAPPGGAPVPPIGQAA